MKRLSLLPVAAQGIYFYSRSDLSFVNKLAQELPKIFLPLSLR